MSEFKTAVEIGTEEANLSSEVTTTISEPTFNVNTYGRREFCLLGYYNFPNQRMKLEDDFPAETEEICRLLTLSFRNISTSSDTYAQIKDTFATAEFIFKDREDNLFAYFPKENLVRITNVVYNRRRIHKVDGILKRWFVIGEDFL